MHVASEDPMEYNDLASSSIARAVESISKASKARPATKMLDPEAVPKLDPPSFPFQRLQIPLKIPQSLKTESDKVKEITRTKRRPQPGKKWKRLISREEKLEEEGGMPRLFNVFVVLCVRCSHLLEKLYMRLYISSSLSQVPFIFYKLFSLCFQLFVFVIITSSFFFPSVSNILRIICLLMKI